MPSLLVIIRESQNQNTLVKHLAEEYARLAKVTSADQDNDLEKIIADELQDVTKDDLDVLRNIKASDDQVRHVQSIMENVLDAKLDKAQSKIFKSVIKLERNLLGEYFARLQAVLKESAPFKVSAKQIQAILDMEMEVKRMAQSRDITAEQVNKFKQEQEKSIGLSAEMIEMLQPYIKAGHFVRDIIDGKQEDVIFADRIPDAMVEIVKPFRDDKQLKGLSLEITEAAWLRESVDLQSFSEQKLDDKCAVLDNFNRALKQSETKISHPSVTWLKWAYDIASTLSILGAVARALWSLKTTGSIKFWKPEGEKLSELSDKEVSKLVRQVKK